MKLNHFIIVLLSVAHIATQHAMFSQSHYTIKVHGLGKKLPYQTNDSFSYAKRTLDDWVFNIKATAEEIRLKNPGIFDDWSDEQLAFAHFHPLIIEKLYLPLALHVPYTKCTRDHGWDIKVPELFEIWPVNIIGPHIKQSGFLCSTFSEKKMLYHRCTQSKSPKIAQAVARAAIAKSRALWLQSQGSLIKDSYKVSADLIDEDGAIVKSYVYNVTEEKTSEKNPHIINVNIYNAETKTGIQLHTGYADPATITAMIQN